MRPRENKSIEDAVFETDDNFLKNMEDKIYIKTLGQSFENYDVITVNILTEEIRRCF